MTDHVGSYDLAGRVNVALDKEGKSSSRLIITGAKGSGKTTLRQMLVETLRANRFAVAEAVTRTLDGSDHVVMERVSLIQAKQLLNIAVTKLRRIHPQQAEG